jgi:hypothetical protein
MTSHAILMQDDNFMYPRTLATVPDFRSDAGGGTWMVRIVLLTGRNPAVPPRLRRFAGGSRGLPFHGPPANSGAMSRRE